MTRFGKFQFLKKHVRQAGVVVLAGVNEDRLDVGVRFKSAQDGRHLHEVWTSANHASKSPHRSVPPSAKVGKTVHECSCRSCCQWSSISEPHRVICAWPG